MADTYGGKQFPLYLTENQATIILRGLNTLPFNENVEHMRFVLTNFIERNEWENPPPLRIVPHD